MQFLEEELRDAGFSARVHAGYDYSFPGNAFDGKPPDLVILCCKEIESDELGFIKSLLRHDCLLVVSCAALERGNSHPIVLANAYVPVGESPNAANLIELVEEAFLNIYRKRALKHSHRLGSGLGLIQFYLSNIRSILKSNDIVNKSLDDELGKVGDDVRSVLERSKGLRRLASESGEREPETVLISGNDLLDQILWVLPSPPANIKLAVEAAEALANVKVVVGQIMDILRNLVENAIEAIADQAGAITIRVFDAHSHLQIEVKDTGFGIPMEHQSEVFNICFSTKGSQGLGLYEARKAARSNRGTLTFTTQPGHGSTFVLRLPVAKKDDLSS